MKLNNLFKRSLTNNKKFSDKSNNDLVHKGFKISIIIKGFDGLLEISGGILLAFLNPARLNRIIALLTQHELSEDPNDKVARYLIALSSKFTISTQSFGIFYLVSHGIVKVVLVTLLWTKKPFAYPLTVISLFLFIIYQIYRYTVHPSVFLIILTVFDIIMIILTILEYKRIKSKSDKIA